MIIAGLRHILSMIAATWSGLYRQARGEISQLTACPASRRRFGLPARLQCRRTFITTAIGFMILAWAATCLWIPWVFRRGPTSMLIRQTLLITLTRLSSLLWHFLPAHHITPITQIP